MENLPKIQFKPKSDKIYYADHHEGEYTLPPLNQSLGRRSKIWDGYLLDEMTSDTLCEKEKGYFFNTWVASNKLGDKVELGEGWEDASIFEIYFYQDSFHERARIEWLYNLFSNALNHYQTASGDDEYFDYMPSHLEIASKILKETGNEAHAKYLDDLEMDD